jgi:hypothetical protein
MAAEMLSIHDGQQPEPSVSGIAEAWEMLGGSAARLPPLSRANLRVSAWSQGTNGEVSGG